jgi:hypothetical protein
LVKSAAFLRILPYGFGLLAFSGLWFVYRPGCLHAARDELCYHGPSLWQARAALAAIEGHHPEFDVRAQMIQSSEGVYRLSLATPDGVRPVDLAPLGRALYHDPAAGALDVFITDAHWEHPRLLHSACPSGATSAACCADGDLTGVPAVPNGSGDPRVPAGGAVADGRYRLASIRTNQPLERFTRARLAIRGSELRSTADWDTDWTGELDCPSSCETYQFRVAGSRLLASKTCPGCSGKDCEATFGFTATDGGIALFTGEGGEPRVELLFVRE